MSTSTSSAGILPASPDRQKVGRRALIATGGITALAVGIGEAPLALTWGQRQLAVELANLEGVGLDTASAAVDATYQAVNLIVMPIAQALTEISAESLDGIITLVEQLRNLPGISAGTKQNLDAFAQILTAWKGNVALFPSAVAALDAVPRDAGKRYLEALKVKQQADAQRV